MDCSREEESTHPDAVCMLTLHATGQVLVVLDAENFDFHVDVAPDASPKWIKFCLQYLDLIGYVPIPLDECDPELLDNDWIRRYFVPREPTDDMPLIVPPAVSA
ncbi:hypothetical protein [Umezawaea sp. Da 62-37]|uniref:hypothetical protein n=1 Tax=Umezawaea sp. Da 62-37 TaxID=3075927 RepID=UPI0028F71FC1|nr:hypothetical protein [Umezawaea sp. Da 62-37]WNV90326.1 hypothetical protein RM788_19205 [Umezawaea sp. Da 62-37]